jgi:nucleotide-binding universal stress UspA family protein
MYEHLLVPLDGSPAAERVLEHAEALATAFGSQITLIRATVSPEMILSETAAGDATVGEIAPILDPDPIVEADEASATEYLDGVAERLRQRNLTVHVEHHEGHASQVIVERAATLHAGLILMTTHGRSGLGRVVFGSVADSVLRHAPCPVLLVRIHEDRSRAS